jgi:hypothetical protein
MDHIEELLKIEKASQGFFRQGIRDEISRKIRTFDPKVNEVKSKSGSEKKDILVKHLKLVTDLRHSAMRQGASSYKDAKWASAALVESWLLLIRDSSQEQVEAAERIIDRMR